MRIFTMGLGSAIKFGLRQSHAVGRGWLCLTLMLLLSTSVAEANPYLARLGERNIKIRIATCAVSGGFAHLYTALENNLFDKYGFKIEHVFIRGSGAALSALSADEIKFLYCAADATLPSL